MGYKKQIKHDTKIEQVLEAPDTQVEQVNSEIPAIPTIQISEQASSKPTRKYIKKSIITEKSPEELLSLIPKNKMKELKNEVLEKKGISKKQRPPRSQKQLENDKKLVEFQKARKDARLKLKEEDEAKLTAPKIVALPTEDVFKKAKDCEKIRKSEKRVEAFIKRVESVMKPVAQAKVVPIIDIPTKADYQGSALRNLIMKRRN